MAVTRWLLLTALLALPVAGQNSKITGLYVHQHWSYNHPYAARTWTFDDWRAFATDLKKLGYNTILIWPVTETMPDPLTPSDRASLDKHGRVIRMLKQELGMRVWIALCPNVAPVHEEAAKATFEKRRFFYTDRRVNPADPEAVAQMFAHREKVLAALRDMDGAAVIDSDPGGFTGSNNQDFVDLLSGYRRMLDRLRPGIELLYWMHAGWAGYSRYYQTAEYKPSTEAEFLDTLQRLAKADPAPWGVATARSGVVEKAGLTPRQVALNYGRIESEPSFPLTNFGGDRAYEGGASAGPRGVLGNAQTHCVQLPNIFAFARGAEGKPVSERDYEQFANRLIPGQGGAIVGAWRSLSGTSPAAMRQAASRIEEIPQSKRVPGDLRGLLFGSGDRFLKDLVLQLRYKAAALDLIAASTAGRGVRDALGAFVQAAQGWQGQHGYENRWYWPELQKATEGLSGEIRLAWEPEIDAKGFAKVQIHYRLRETMTPRIISAMRRTWDRMK
ncbi:MAG: hypothetical protein FJW39_16115 [Acidobacteria bacterium]|nr:hypothetical protein [Acidobacteriota bacterium]